MKNQESKVVRVQREKFSYNVKNTFTKDTPQSTNESILRYRIKNSAFGMNGHRITPNLPWGSLKTVTVNLLSSVEILNEEISNYSKRLAETKGTDFDNEEQKRKFVEAGGEKSDFEATTSTPINHSNCINPSSLSKDKRETELSDSEIVVEIAGGNLEAFNILDFKYREGILRTAKMTMRGYQLRDSNEAANDVVQDTFIKVISAITSGKFRSDANIKNYLIGAVKRNCLAHMKQNNSQKLPKFFEDINYSHKFADDLEDEKMSYSQVDSLIEISEDRQAKIMSFVDINLLNKLLNDLKPEFKKVIVLKEIENKSHEQIAKVLNISVSKSKNRLSLGKKKLNSLLQKELF